ncbi:MAG: chromosome segregation protein SMC, partial [Clostridia bacterium]|nr:chromosome segregation protein SMC [Clostridia bacterium]
KNALLFSELSVKIDQSRQNIAQMNEQIATLGGNISVIENDILHNNTDIERLNTEINELKGHEDSAKAEIANNRTAADEKKAKIAEIELKIRAAEEKLNSLLTDSENFSRHIEELSQQLNAISGEFADLRVAQVSALSSIDEINLRAEALDQLIVEKQGEKEALDGEFNETAEMADKLEENIKECENAVKGYNMRLETRQAKANELKTQLDEIHLDIEAKKRRIQILEELEKNMEGFNHSVKQVISNAKGGLLRGVHGAVAGIIDVKKEYSVAIETALGNALQNIVTETDADAKRAINYLKESNSGRATFLPISSIKARPFMEKGFEDMFGYVGIASDIIDCEPKYKEIIKYLLGAVVVTEDIDSAVTIAKKFNYHFKVVSLDGQVINAGGSLTGGSLIKNAGLLSRKEDIKRIDAEIAKLNDKQTRLTAEYDLAVEEVNKITADITAANAVLTTATEDRIRALAELKRIGDMRDAAAAVINQYVEEKNNSAEKKAQLTAIAEKAEADMAELTNKKDAIQGEIDSSVGGRDSLSHERETVTEAITALKLSVIEYTKDVENLLAVALSVEMSLNNRDERIAALYAEIEKINGLNDAKNNDIAAINETIEAIKNQITVTEGEIVSFAEQRNEIEKQGTELRSNEREKTQEREKISGELARLTERKENMLAEYDNIIKQLFDEYNLTRSEAENMGIVIENAAEAKKTLAEIKSSIRNLGSVNVAAIEEFKEVKERYDFMSEQIADVEKSRAELTKLINQLTSQMQEMFIEGFTKINESFSKTFTELFGGGSAKLVLTDPDNILESGIDINAKLPGKNVPSLDGCSGGEKALIALSIYFSIMRVNAPP